MKNRLLHNKDLFMFRIILLFILSINVQAKNKIWINDDSTFSISLPNEYKFFMNQQFKEDSTIVTQTIFTTKSNIISRIQIQSEKSESNKTYDISNVLSEKLKSFEKDYNLILDKNIDYSHNSCKIKSENFDGEIIYWKFLLSSDKKIIFSVAAIVEDAELDPSATFFYEPILESLQQYQKPLK